MSSAGLDRLLAALIVGLGATGALSLVSGDPADAWVFVAHDLLAAALLAGVVVKLARSVPRAVRARRWSRLAVAALVTTASVASLVGGFLWVLGASIIWVDLGVIRWSLLTVHAVAGLALLPLVLVHLLPRRWRILRPRTRRTLSDPGPAVTARISRRALLVGGAYGAVSVLLVGAAATVDTLRGGARRFTGSRWLPAGPPGVPTTFLGEPTPSVDLAAWRLRVSGRVARDVAVDLDGLARLATRDVTAVLDCTSGWAVEATWTGVPLADVLALAGAAQDAARVDIVSVTGWRASLARDDAERCLLAWAEGRQPISAAHGAPLRLVAPDRRGLDWVKWIHRIEVA
ncbi:MAG TPA: molybdopterin-dependent oxidoreductase [Candidatus Limnocylindrales bacterium]|nr:molybdopterin-dependent oxidoreductase [Candidatus Limnocylindrales bacterium]